MGVLIFKGMKMGVLDGDFTITERDDGGIDAQLLLATAYNVLPIWIRIANDNLVRARKASEKIAGQWSSDDDKNRKLLISELESSMQVFVSCGIALDALYDQLRPFAKVSATQVESWKKNKTSRAKQIAEVIRRVYRLQKNTLNAFKSNIAEIVQYRDLAVHPSLELKRACSREDLGVDVDWKFAAFRYSNADTCFRSTMQMLTYLHHTRCREQLVNEQIDNAFETLEGLKVARHTKITTSKAVKSTRI